MKEVFSADTRLKGKKHHSTFQRCLKNQYGSIVRPVYIIHTYRKKVELWSRVNYIVRANVYILYFMMGTIYIVNKHQACKDTQTTEFPLKPLKF